MTRKRTIDRADERASIGRYSDRVFLLSPARCDGRRAEILLNPAATFDMAQRLNSAAGAPLGAVFRFLSGLYFRGKLAYAEEFARRADGGNATLIITTDRGLVPPDTPVHREDIVRFSQVDIAGGDPRYIAPLRRDAERLAGELPPDTSVVLLGSIATGKYADLLTDVFGQRLVFPTNFVGRGDMSRGGILLRCVREHRELQYEPVLGAVRHGKRPPKLERGMAARKKSVVIPTGERDVEMLIGGRTVSLTNLEKVFWTKEGITKRDLLQYYADISPVLLPHLKNRAMVMKRYPNGASGKCFFMKRAPSPRPDWIETCAIEHDSGNIIDFPIVQDLASLLWIVNLGCIDLNQWYATCDDVDRPDYLHFDLDPVPGATFAKVLRAALAVRDALLSLGMKPLVKTTGSSGVHVYVPIVRGPTQKQVWTFAKALAQELAADDPKLLTAEYRIANRPRGRVLVDYNQNAWGRTLASIYSPRPKPRATVSTPVTWEEVEAGFAMTDFRIDTVPARVAKLGDLWKPLLAARGRFKLEALL